ECERRAPYFLGPSQRSFLCQNATTIAPAECAWAAQKAVGLSNDFVLKLCVFASSSAPGSCVARLSTKASKTFTPDLRVRLCKDEMSEGPARCVEHINVRLPPQLMVDVCKGGLGTAPAECLNLVSRLMLGEAAVKICKSAETVGPGVCAISRSLQGLDNDIIGDLCHGALGGGPAECYSRAVHLGQLLPEQRIDLCKGAISDAPAKCIGEVRDPRLDTLHRLLLCRDATNTAAAKCVSASALSLSVGHRVSLCAGAKEENVHAPVKCLKKIPQDFPLAIGVELCAGASNSEPAECVKAVRYAIADPDHILALCKGVSSTTPALCAVMVVRARGAPQLAISLCKGSESMSPASCFAMAPAQISASLRAQACRGAMTDAPATCLKVAMPRSHRHPDWGESLCPLNPEAASSSHRRLSHEMAAKLCQGTIDNAPALCGKSTPAGMQDKDVLTLCEASGGPAGEVTAACAGAALTWLTGTDAAHLCAGALSTAPAFCAEAIAPRLGGSTRVSVCSRALNDTPARCINSIIGPPSAADVAACRIAVPVPSNLEITYLHHDGDLLHPGSPMQAVLEVQDQWGWHMTGDHSTIVRVSVAVHGSGGASVDGIRTNTSQGGIVEFSQLIFTGAGNLTVQFSIGSTTMASALVVVAETKQGLLTKQCMGIFSSLACPAGSLDIDRQQPTATEAVSVALGDRVWHALACADLLEENGVHVAVVNWVRQGTVHVRTAWLWYHSGIEMLETGVGLPLAEGKPWEQLGVDRNASASEVRQAYHQKSLIWHPDRWARYPMHAMRAQEVFEVVSEAYSKM
ncbi:unnamed protein product, partial [Choristocarpus tenellus]